MGEPSAAPPGWARPNDATKQPRLYELRSIKLSRSPHPVATVVQNDDARARQEWTNEPPSPSRPSDEWMQPIFVVDDHKEEDVLEVAINLSFVERQLGARSAETVKEVQRITLAAFGVIGATAVHRLLKDRSLQVLGYRPEWPWEAVIRRRKAMEAAVQDVLLTSCSDDTSTAFRMVLLLVMFIAVAAGLFFRQTTVGVAYSGVQ